VASPFWTGEASIRASARENRRPKNTQRRVGGIRGIYIAPYPGRFSYGCARDSPAFLGPPPILSSPRCLHAAGSSIP
jgi:hypothetical protein